MRSCYRPSHFQASGSVMCCIFLMFNFTLVPTSFLIVCLLYSLSPPLHALFYSVVCFCGPFCPLVFLLSVFNFISEYPFNYEFFLFCFFTCSRTEFLHIFKNLKKLLDMNSKTSPKFGCNIFVQFVFFQVFYFVTEFCRPYWSVLLHLSF